MLFTRCIPRAGLALLLAAPALAAQLSGRVVITPYLGAYLPTNTIIRGEFTAPGTTASLHARHDGSVATGANVSYWMNERFAFEIGGLYTSGHIKGDGLVNESGALTAMTIQDNGHVWAGSAKVMMQLLSPDNPMNLRLGIGPALISRGGTAYKEDVDGKFTGLTDVGAAVSLCTRLAVTNALSVRLRAEDYIYRSKLRFESPDASSLQFGARTQNDLLLSFGLQFFVTP